MLSHTNTVTDNELRQRFRSAREAKGWSQSDLADRLEVHLVTVSKLERGVMALTKEWIARLGAELDMTVDLTVTAPDDDIIHLVSTRDGLSIREAREALGWSQAELAAKAGTYQQMVDRIESGAIKRSKLVPAVKAALGLETSALIPDQNKSRLSELLEQVEEINDLLHALDKVGDGIGGSDGFAVSAVAINAKSIADNVLNALKAMGAK